MEAAKLTTERKAYEDELALGGVLEWIKAHVPLTKLRQHPELIEWLEGYHMALKEIVRHADL